MTGSDDVGSVIKDSTAEVASERLKGDHEWPISDLSIVTSDHIPCPEGRDSYAERNRYCLNFREKNVLHVIRYYH